MFFIIKDSLYFVSCPRKLPTLNFRTENLWMNIQPEKLQEKNIHNYLWWHDMPWINISISDINMYKSFWINMWKDYEWLTTNGCGLRRNIFGVHLELFQVIYSSQLPVTGALFRLWYWHSNILVIYTNIPWQTGRHNVKRVGSQLLPEYCGDILLNFLKHSLFLTD